MRKKYPSQIKYEEENPLTCFRSKKEEKERIRSMAVGSGKSISELVRMVLLNQERDFSNAIAAAEKRGYQKGKQDYGIVFSCKVCSKWEYIPPNSNCHEAVVEFLKEKGWGHEECHKQ